MEWRPSFETDPVQYGEIGLLMKLIAHRWHRRCLTMYVLEHMLGEVGISRKIGGGHAVCRRIEVNINVIEKGF